VTVASEDWARDLSKKLADLDQVFNLLEEVRFGRLSLTAEEEEAIGARQDGGDIPHQYARVLTRLIDALERLPNFADGRGLLTLSTLRLDLMNLDEGNAAQRLTPRARHNPHGTPAGRRVYQAQVILCVRLLEEIGQSGSAAREKVAAIFSKHGHRGQQRGPLSPDTLTRWRESVLAPDGPHLPGRRMIEQRLAEWKSHPGWPPSLEDALNYVEVRARRKAISLAASK
jgi:hypothetical protein